MFIRTAERHSIAWRQRREEPRAAAEPRQDALDLGCSVGESTLALHDWLEHGQAAHG